MSIYFQSPLSAVKQVNSLIHYNKQPHICIEVPVARRGRPPNPEKQQQPEKKTRNPGRPPDPTKHRPYSGPRVRVLISRTCGSSIEII